MCSVEAYVTKNKVFCGGTQTIAPYDNCRPGKKILKGHEGKLCLIDITGIIKSKYGLKKKTFCSIFTAFYPATFGVIRMVLALMVFERTRLVFIVMRWVIALANLN